MDEFIENDDERESDIFRTLDLLFGVDVCELPIFSDETDIPENDGQGGAYSWDKTHYLHMDNYNGWCLLKRSN